MPVDGRRPAVRICQLHRTSGYDGVPRLVGDTQSLTHAGATQVVGGGIVERTVFERGRIVLQKRRPIAPCVAPCNLHSILQAAAWWTGLASLVDGIGGGGRPAAGVFFFIHGINSYNGRRFRRTSLAVG